TELSNQYLVTYRSPGEAGAEVSLSVTVGGATDESLVPLPKAAVPEQTAAPAPQPAPQAQPLLDGAWGLGITLGLTFLAVFALAALVFGTAARRRRQRVLAQRVAARPKLPEEGGRGDAGGRGVGDWVPEPLVDAAERFASAGGFGARLDRTLERAGAPLRVGEFTVGSLLAAVLGGVVGAILFQRLLLVAVFALVGGAIPVIVLSITMNRRINKLHAQLPDILMLLASSLRAGHSFFQALSTVAEEIGDPAADELGRVVSEIRLGRPVDEALDALADRVGSDDFHWAVLAVNIQREVGGNLAEVLDTVADTVREREVIRRQVRVLSAEGRLSAVILTALPFVIGLYISQVNPEYLTPLFTTRTGIMMLVVAGALLSVGALWIRRMVKIDV
ncbi:MAG TPA: type II secretion system F family protein, partial [Actinomycetota bacterium]|nr:type II secretion system F family protein [Actinomycetota bacterium]